MTWCTKIISNLLQGWLDLWNLQNGDRHGRDSTHTKAKALKAQAIREWNNYMSLKDRCSKNMNGYLRFPCRFGVQ
jgi:hypothetical protein